MNNLLKVNTNVYSLLILFLASRLAPVAQHKIGKQSSDNDDADEDDEVVPQLCFDVQGAQDIVACDGGNFKPAWSRWSPSVLVIMKFVVQ